MKTKFPYGPIDFDSYFQQYLAREDAVKMLPDRQEIRELARKNVVKDHLILVPLKDGEAAKTGDTLTLCTQSSLPKFNKDQVTVSIGRGLYNKALEEALVGLKKGETCHVTVKDQPVSATILGIKRKAAPEPTDEMAAELHQKDFDGKELTTLAEYEDYLIKEKTMEAVSTVNYYVMESIMKDYPVDHYEEEDIRVLGELEKESFHRLFLEQEGVDLFTLPREEMQERFHCDTFDDFITMRYDWYKIKIHQCLIYLNILGLPCEGKTDPLDHYEVLSELTQKMYDKIEKMLRR